MPEDHLPPGARGGTCPLCGSAEPCTCRRTKVALARLAKGVAADVMERAIRASAAFPDPLPGRAGVAQSSLLIGHLAAVFPGDEFRVVPGAQAVPVVAQRVRWGEGPALGVIVWLVADVTSARDLLRAAQRARADMDAEMAVVVVPGSSPDADFLPYGCGDRVLVVDQRQATAVAAALREIVIDRRGIGAAADQLRFRVEALGGLLSAELLHRRVGDALDAATAVEARGRRGRQPARPRTLRRQRQPALRALEQLSRELRLLRVALADAIEKVTPPSPGEEAD